MRGLWVVLLLAVALAAPALAQGPVPAGGVGASFQPGALDVPLGGVALGTLLLENDRLHPVTLDLAVTDDARLTVVLGTVEVLLAPRSSRSVPVEVFPSAALPPGDVTLVVRVSERATPGLSEGGVVTAALTLRLVDLPLPTGSPLVSPRVLPPTEAAPNASRLLDLLVRHEASSNQSFSLRAFPPPGWTVTARGLRVEAGEEGTLGLNVTALAGAVNGTARLVLQNDADASLAAVADLPLSVTPRDAPAATSAAPEPEPEPEPQADAEPAREEAPAREEPPADAEAAPVAPATDAPASEPQEEPPAAPPPAEAPPPPAPRPSVLLRVEPRVLRVPPGGVAEARLVVESDADARVPVRLALPPGLAGDLAPRVLDVRAGERLDLPFRVEVAPGAANGTRLEAAVESDAAPPAPFTVLVDAPPPPAELVSLSAPEPVGGHGAARSTWLAALAALVGAAALGFAWARRRWPLLAAALYARLRPQAILDHPIRQRLAREAQDRPGRSIREVQRELGLANGAMAHHLRTLEKAGIVRVVPDGMLRRVYPAGHERVEAVPPLADRIVSLVRERGECSPRDIADALGATRQSVHYHLQRLAREGRLRARVDGRETRFRSPESPPGGRPPRPAGT